MRRIAIAISFAILASICFPIAASAQTNKVLVVKINTEITAATTILVRDALSIAESLDARLVVFEVNTPGGEINAVKDIMDLFESSTIPICFFVYPIGSTAWSGGTYLLVSSHVAAMASGASIGSAQPILSTGQLVNDTKHVNALTALMVNHATVHNRNTTAATQFVAINLNLGPEEALKYHVIEIIADDLKSLLEKLSLNTLIKTESAAGTSKWMLISSREAASYSGYKVDFTLIDRSEVVNYSPGIQSWILGVLFNPLASSLMFILGFILLSTGLQTPGFGAELTGVILLLLSLLSMGVIGLEPMIILLFALGFALMIAELKTHIGILGIGGVICFIIGAFMLFPSPQWLLAPDVALTIRNILLVTSSTFSIFFGVLVYKVAQARRLKVRTGYDSIKGSIGVVHSRLSPEGEVRIQGEIWRARSLEGIIEKGANTVVVEREGLVMIVKAATTQPDARGKDVS